MGTGRERGGGHGWGRLEGTVLCGREEREIDRERWGGSIFRGRGRERDEGGTEGLVYRGREMLGGTVL